MIVVLALDGLEINKVEEYDCKNLKQAYYGKSDISDFPQTRTMILWSSFLTGRNCTQEILDRGDHAMWDTRWGKEETWLRYFKNPVVLDLPGYTYDKEFHDRSRNMLKQFFEVENPEEKEKIKKEYNKDTFDHHKKMKELYFQKIEEDTDIVIAYFHIADVIGHLNFGNNTLMRMIYQDLDEIAAKTKEKASKLIIILVIISKTAIERASSMLLLNIYTKIMVVADAVNLQVILFTILRL